MNRNIKHIIAVISFFIFTAIFSFDYFSSFGISLFLFFGIKFFNEIGEKIEIRDIMILIAILQWVIGPLLAYKIYPDEEMYYMAVEIDEYMQFVVPATFAFALGLYIPLKKDKSEKQLLDSIKEFTKKNKNIDLTLIAIGLFMNLTIDFFPSSIKFAVVLVSDVRFIGLFFLFLNKRKYKWIFVGLVLSTIVIVAMRHGMFHELILWLSFFMIIVSFVIKPTVRTKIISLVIFLFLIISIQTI